MQKIKILTLQLKNRPESDITIELLGPYIISLILLILPKNRSQRKGGRFNLSWDKVYK